jgi:hypothetical protein
MEEKKMSNVKLKRVKHDGPLLLRRGGTVYQISHDVKCVVPVGIAVGMLGDAGLVVELTSEDREAISNFGANELRLIKKEFNLQGSSEEVAETLFPTKKKTKPKKKVMSKPKAETSTKFEDLVNAAKKDSLKTKKEKVVSDLEE